MALPTTEIETGTNGSTEQGSGSAFDSTSSDVGGNNSSGSYPFAYFDITLTSSPNSTPTGFRKRILDHVLPSLGRNSPTSPVVSPRVQVLKKNVHEKRE